MEWHHWVRKTEINWDGILKNKDKTEKTYVVEKEHSDMQVNSGGKKCQTPYQFVPKGKVFNITANSFRHYIRS
jgi:hypothetical protein